MPCNDKKKKKVAKKKKAAKKKGNPHNPRSAAQAAHVEAKKLHALANSDKAVYGVCIIFKKASGTNPKLDCGTVLAKSEADAKAIGRRVAKKVYGVTAK